MTTIPLACNIHVTVDPEDSHLLNDRFEVNNVGYLYRVRDNKFLHHLIVGKIPGLEVDHINQNKYDNRRENLRHVTRGDNCRNRCKFYRNRNENSSQYKHIYPSYSKKTGKVVSWGIEIRNNYKKLKFGSYKDELIASLVADAIKLHLTPNTPRHAFNHPEYLFTLDDAKQYMKEKQYLKCLEMN